MFQSAEDSPIKIAFISLFLVILSLLIAINSSSLPALVRFFCGKFNFTSFRKILNNEPQPIFVNHLSNKKTLMTKTINKVFVLIIAGVAAFTGCGDDDDNDNSISEPEAYSFTRDGKSTVSFSGQTTRISMGEEIIDALLDTTFKEMQINAMFAHEKGAKDFKDETLNASDKSVRSKTAASSDLFSANTTKASAIKAEFDGWIADQVKKVFPEWKTAASEGQPGFIQEAGGGPTRYVNAKGLELNQAFNKGLIGALMVDQIVNNYVSTSVLDAGTNKTDNDTETLAEGKMYTNMEHKWDEAYGYAYGTSENKATPNATIGKDDSFLNKYIGRVEGDEDFEGIADEIYQAFKRGRAAIVAGDYAERDEQTAIIREKISEVVAVRAVYYLQQGKAGLVEKSTIDRAAVFHDLSEGYGFIYSLQFTRKPESNSPYFSNSEVKAMLTNLMDDGANGLWNVKRATLDEISNEIAAKFSFTVSEAGS